MIQTARAFPFRTRDGGDGVVRVARRRDARACLVLTEATMKERPRTLAITDREFWTSREWRRHRLGWGPRGVWLVAEIDGEVIGSYSISRSTRRATMHGAEFGIVVAPDARGRGAGSALIRTGEAWALDVGVTRIGLSVFDSNPRAQALYRALGYVEEGREHAAFRFPEGYVDAIRMYKLVDASPTAGPDR